MFNDFDAYESLLYTYDAMKELIFSKYFPNFLGCNLLSDQYYNQYFMELTKGKTLETILERGEYKLNPGMDLFRFWMREIFIAIKDILHKTVYMPILPLRTKHIFIHENGLKVYMKGIRYSGLRKEKS